MITRLISGVLAIFLLYMSTLLAGMSYGLSNINFWNLESFIVVGVISYFCVVAATGQFRLDLNGLKLMEKIIMPVAWIGFLIGFIMILLGSDYDSEYFMPRFAQSLSIALITIFYGLIIKLILTIIINSKSNS
tara:strand:- start:346 stop:744 length:399 start_codon:yes stop_codon:yes gene_type:complete